MMNTATESVSEELKAEDRLNDNQGQTIQIHSFLEDKLLLA